MNRFSVAIVGGGITGLSAAYFLEKRSPTPIRILLFEKDRRAGGLIETFHFEDFVIEKGPEAIVSYKKSGIELCESLGLSESFIESNLKNQKTFMLTGGELHPLPSGILSPFQRSAAAHGLTFAFTPLLSLWGKIRILLEPLVPRKLDSADESVRHFIIRRMGKNFYHGLVEPLLSGIYGKNPGELSARMILKELTTAEKNYGSITKALFKTKRKKVPKKSLFLSFKNGLDALTDKLVQSLRSTEIHLSQPVEKIIKIGKQFECLGQPFNAVILASPAFASARMLESIDPELAKLLLDIPYRFAKIFTYAFHRSAVGHPLKGYGFLVSPDENLPFHACTWTTSKWDYRAPEGTVLIRAYASSEADEKQIMETLRSVLSIQGDPLFAEKFTLPAAMPLYRVGHPDRILKIKNNLCRHPGLFLAGAAYEGVGIPDCIDSARQASTAVIDSLYQKDSIAK